jgi:hypothetical protein
MSNAEIEGLIRRFNKDFTSYTEVKRSIDKMDPVIQKQNEINSMNQQIIDSTVNTLNHQRTELDTKGRIIDYTEKDIRKNFSLLNTQFILFITIIVMISVIVLYMVITYITENNIAEIASNFMSRIRGTGQSTI